MVGGAALFDLTGRTALVTGGGSGLGLAIAQALAGQGATVLLVGRQAGKLEEAAGAIRRDGGKAHALPCDLLDRDATQSMLAAAGRQHGAIDILVNNAGVQHRQPVGHIAPADWQRIVDTNLSAPFFLAQEVGRSMCERESGKIINILSLLAEFGRPTVVPYASAKGGLKMLTKALAVEFGPRNVQVNGIAPGYFKTEMNEALAADPQFSTWLIGRTPMRRWGEPGDIAGAAIFLASRASDFVTGHVLAVDGGVSAAV